MFINENKVFFPAVRRMMDIGVIVCDHDVLLYLLARCWLLWHLPCIHWQLGTGDSPDHPPNISSEKCPMKEKQNLVVVLECCWETFFNKFEVKVLHQVSSRWKLFCLMWLLPSLMALLLMCCCWLSVKKKNNFHTSSTLKCSVIIIHFYLAKVRISVTQG